MSASREAKGYAGGVDAKYSFDLFSYDAYLSLNAGIAKVDDHDSSFDRTFGWFAVEPFVSFNSNWYAILRYSEIGTYKGDEGFAFGGKIFASGIVDFGYDARRLQRLAVGVGWTPNPHIKTKLEIGKDWFRLIDASPLDPRNNQRLFVGLEVAVGF